MQVKNKARKSSVGSGQLTESIGEGKKKPPTNPPTKNPETPPEQPRVALSNTTSRRLEAVEHLQSESERRFTGRFVICLHQGQDGPGAGTKTGPDPQQPGTLQIREPADLQGSSLFSTWAVRAQAVL